MKTITQTFTLFITLLILPLVLFGQAKSITSENYNIALNEAESKTDKQIRKVVMIQKFYKNGEVTGTLTTTSEAIPPDKSKWLYVEKSGGFVVKQMEGIRIGNFEYRKEENSEWVRREWDDYQSYGLAGSGVDDSTREYFIEEATIGKEKFQVLIEKKVYGGKTNFEESKVWINKKGLIVKKTSTTSILELKNISSSTEFTYNYKAAPPKIEAPVKFLENNPF